MSDDTTYNTTKLLGEIIDKKMQSFIQDKLIFILNDIQASVKKEFPDYKDGFKVKTHLGINLFGNLIISQLEDISVEKRVKGCGLAVSFMIDWFDKILSHLHKETEMN